MRRQKREIKQNDQPNRERSGDESLSPETVIDKRRWRDKERWRENKSSVMWERWWWWGGGKLVWARMTLLIIWSGKLVWSQSSFFCWLWVMDAGIDEFVEAMMMLSIESRSTFHSPMNVLSGCQNASRMDGSFNHQIFLVSKHLIWML